MKTRTRLILAAMVIVILLLLILVGAMEGAEGQGVGFTPVVTIVKPPTTKKPPTIVKPSTPGIPPTLHQVYLPLMIK